MADSLTFEDEVFLSMSDTFSEIDKLNGTDIIAEAEVLETQANPDPDLCVNDGLALIDNITASLDKLYSIAKKYNNEKALYAIQLAMADIQGISDQSQEK